MRSLSRGSSKCFYLLSVIRRILIYYNTMFRWASMGQAIERIWQTQERVISFLDYLDTQEARKQLQCLTNERNMIAVAFLEDILNFFK